jgi:hypothetical protein
LRITLQHGPQAARDRDIRVFRAIQGRLDEVEDEQTHHHAQAEHHCRLASSLIGTARRVRASRSWSEPLLDDRRGTLPDFPTDTLTEPWRTWLTAQQRHHDVRGSDARAVRRLRAALRQVGISDDANARRVLRWAQANGKDTLSVLDVRRDALAQQLNAEKTEALLGKLERAGWLKKVTEKTPGRARHRWVVNSQLLVRGGHAGSAESAGSP